VKVFPDGREKFNLQTYEGRKLWKIRRREVWMRDQGICQICHDPRPMTFGECTMDHLNPCGMGGGFRDDRAENLRCAHYLCNTAKGSKRELPVWEVKAPGEERA
jgi:5-methylcytosine-specific restriction endonuclease McrA